MNINIRLYGSLRDHLPREKRGKDTLDFPNGATVDEVLKLLGITQPVLVALNDEQEVDFDTVLSEGDRLGVFVQAAGG